MRLSAVARGVTGVGYAALVVTIIVWFGGLGTAGRWLAAALLVPLVFPLRGLARGLAYTHAWASMMALFYMVLAMTEIMSNPMSRPFAYPTLAASGVFFLGCVFYVRCLARERAVEDRARQARRMRDGS